MHQQALLSAGSLLLHSRACCVHPDAPCTLTLSIVNVDCLMFRRSDSCMPREAQPCHARIQVFELYHFSSLARVINTANCQVSRSAPAVLKCVVGLGSITAREVSEGLRVWLSAK
jgi:hypothetical protein